MTSTFDPSAYLIKLKGRDYLPVAFRLLWLRTEYPDAKVETWIVEHDRAERWIQFGARITIPAGGSATGFGQEDAKGFAGNPGDYPEKAETKALGRALAALGFGTQFCVDFDFDEGGQRVVDSPAQQPAKGATEAQRSAAPGNSPQRGAAPQAGHQSTAPTTPRTGQQNAPSGHLADEARKLAPTGLARLTGEKRGQANVLDLDGVECVIEETPRGKVYTTILRCSEHTGMRWYSRLNDKGQITPWQHKTRDGVCTMPEPAPSAVDA